jgi:Mn2+/Fe2+ NRAMP family transporter
MFYQISLGIMTSEKKSFTHIFLIIGPGILIAATGVGAGDLATGAITGSKLGVAILWAVILGAFLKFVLNEGLARWQLSTGETLLEGALSRGRLPVQIFFIIYMFLTGLSLKLIVLDILDRQE